MSDRRENLPIFSSSLGIAEGPLRPDSSLSAAIQVWGEDLEESGRAVNTVKAFTGDLRLLARFMGAGHSINSIGTSRSADNCNSARASNDQLLEIVCRRDAVAYNLLN